LKAHHIKKSNMVETFSNRKNDYQAILTCVLLPINKIEQGDFKVLKKYLSANNFANYCKMQYNILDL